MLLNRVLLIGLFLSLANTIEPAPNYTGYVSSDLQKAIILKNSIEIKQLLNSGTMPDDTIICFAMDNKLTPDILLALISSSPFNLSHTFSNDLNLLRYSLKFPFKDYVKVLIYLLDQGVEITLPDDYLRTNGNLGGHAYGEFQISLVQAFLRNGYKPDFILDSGVWNYVCMAWYSKECWGLLLSSGLNPNKEIEQGPTSMPLLIWAINKRYVDLVQLLIDYKALLNQYFINYDGSLVTPLAYTISRRTHAHYNKELEEIISILVGSAHIFNEN